jgi:hypothetical protein
VILEKLEIEQRFYKPLRMFLAMSWTVENHIVRAQHRSHKRENLGVVFNRCIRYSFHQSPDGGSSGLGQPDVAGSISLDRLTAQRPMGKKKSVSTGNEETHSGRVRDSKSI